MQLRYDYTGDRYFLEGADWTGRRPNGLERHYHHEVQVSIIWRGERDYCIGKDRVRLRPGQILVVPSRRTHHALPSLHGDVRSTEFYIRPTALAPDTTAWLDQFSYVLYLEQTHLLQLSPAEAAERITQCLDSPYHAAMQAPRQSLPENIPSLITAAIEHDRVLDAARALGLSREGFIRTFARKISLTPHAYRINFRLNAARDLLRQGEAIADVAYATGFSDQSHFGRMFLRFFGTTPGRFRNAHTGER